MALRYRVPLPGPFYYSGRVGLEHWLPCGSRTGSDPMGFTVKWFIIYPSVAIFGAGLAIMLAPFYGVFWGVRRSLRNRQRCQPVAQRFPVQRPLPQRPAPRPVSRPYGFVPAQRERAAARDGTFGSDWCVRAAPPRLFRRAGIVSSVPCDHGMEDAAICGPSSDILGVMGRRVENQRLGLWWTSHPGGVDGRASAP